MTAGQTWSRYLLDIIIMVLLVGLLEQSVRECHPKLSPVINPSFYVIDRKQIHG